MTYTNPPIIEGGGPSDGDTVVWDAASGTWIAAPGTGGSSSPTIGLLDTIAETMPRWLPNVALPAVQGGSPPYLGYAPVELTAGDEIGHLAWFSIGAAVTPTHQWLGIFQSDDDYVTANLLAATADQLTNPIGADTYWWLPIASTAAEGAADVFVVPESGVYLLGLTCTAGTPPTALGYGIASDALVLANGAVGLGYYSYLRPDGSIPPYPYNVEIYVDSADDFIWLAALA